MTTELPLLATPADGVPPLVDTPAEFSSACAELAQGSGPIAIDAERASGIRYGQRAFLVQLRRANAGTYLLAAGFIALMRLPAVLREQAQSFLHDLAVGTVTVHDSIKVSSSSMRAPRAR